MHLQRNDATIRWEDSKTGGKRIVRQIRDGKNSACAIRNIKGGAPPRKRKTLRFARSGEPLYGYAIVGEKTGERIIMYGYLLPYPILIYICIELFDEMQAQRFSAVALLLNRYQLLSFSLLNAVIQADMQKFLIRCKDNTTRTQNQTCPGFSGGVRRP